MLLYGRCIGCVGEYQAQQWTMLIQECKASGMSIKEFREQVDISEKSFYYWQRKFRKQVLEAELMPRASYIQQNFTMKYSNAYTNCYLD